MKSILSIFIAFFVLFASSCSKEDQAKSMVKDYLKANLNDPSSLEIIEWTDLDSIVSYNALDEEISNKKSELEELLSVYKTLEEQNKNLNDDSIKLNQYKDSIQYITYKIDHLYDEYQYYSQSTKKNRLSIGLKYRAANGFGAKILSFNTFVFNKEFSGVSHIYEDSEVEPVKNFD